MFTSRDFSYQYVHRIKIIKAPATTARVAARSHHLSCLLSGVLSLLLQHLIQLDLSHERLEANQSGNAEGTLCVKQRVGDGRRRNEENNTDVRRAASQDGLHGDTLHNSHTIKRAFRLQRANANLKFAAFNATNNVCNVVDGIRTLEQVHDGARLRIRAAHPVALRGDHLRRQGVRVRFNQQVARVRRGNFGNVELLVESLSDTVEDGESSLISCKKKSQRLVSHRATLKGIDERFVVYAQRNHIAVSNQRWAETQIRSSKKVYLDSVFSSSQSARDS